jgi:exodeoxyribonuclease V alpha subunit
MADLNAMLAKLRAEKAAKALLAQSSTASTSSLVIEESTPIKKETLAAPRIIDKYGKEITLNEKQSAFAASVLSGEDCVLIGAAGTGKTTTQKYVVQQLVLSGKAGLLDAQDHKHLISGTPGIVVCAYTRRAVANIKRNMPEDMQNNCVTIHKLLEYQPVYYETYDETSGEEKTKMVFEATRNAGRPLPESIRYVIIEEGSMLSTALYLELAEALPHRPIFIFLGDIQQLPPIFGPAILGFKLNTCKTTELTEVYRQALESPIIRLAHRILSAKPIPPEEYTQWKFPGQLNIAAWTKKISADLAMKATGDFFKSLIAKDAYDYENDVILMPFNKAFGTDELNKIIANELARRRGSVTWEIVAGFNKYYLSPGDRVLYDKEDATVIDIYRNPVYTGAMPIPESATLDYWGYDSSSGKKQEEHHVSEDDIDFMLNQVASSDGEDRVRQCSHVIVLKMNDSDQEIKLTKASEVNALILGYALTVHKSQGSEWRKVFFICHQSNNTMLQRELLYTAVTRAREELFILCESDTLTKGINSQRVRGNTLEEKAEFFKGKIDEGFRLEEPWS